MVLRVTDVRAPIVARVKTTAQATNIRIASERLPLRAAAMLLRAVGESLRVAHVRRRLEQEVAERRDRFAWRFGARWIPVDDQVAHQVRTVLAAAHWVTATTEADPAPRTLAEDSAARG
ncbi:hypothetical protein [Peterkaempfera griseoplana]|uniref:hypothetical protein n=1 Tax=Peterkaempfera griseoplana TaxID=66896 RepID=UPI0006E2820D|nr:hypothetical protein [Peterkaempfera griseoplana]